MVVACVLGFVAEGLHGSEVKHKDLIDLDAGRDIGEGPHSLQRPVGARKHCFDLVVEMVGDEASVRPEGTQVFVCWCGAADDLGPELGW